MLYIILYYIAYHVIILYILDHRELRVQVHVHWRPDGDDDDLYGYTVTRYEIRDENSNFLY